MKPRLFQLNDLLLMWIPTVIVGVIVGAIVWNYTSPNGETIPWPGFLVSSLTIVGCLGIVGAFYWSRFQFIQEYRYTTIHGVSCYFGPGTTVYTRTDVEEETSRLIQIWSTKPGNVLCEFLASGDFWIRVGPWKRHVYGAQQGNAIVVGQGGRPLKSTSFGHELSHILLNVKEGREVPEGEAHRKFQEVGV